MRGCKRRLKKGWTEGPGETLMPPGGVYARTGDEAGLHAPGAPAVRDEDRDDAGEGSGDA
jgi:hypothetical protein